MNLVLFNSEEIIIDTNGDDTEQNHKSSRIILDSKDDRYKHIRKHLRKMNGDSVRIGIINESTGIATLRQHNVEDDKIILESLEMVPLDMDMPKVDLILGMMQPQTLKRLWPVIASLGLCRITITGCDLCDDAYKDSSIITPKIYNPLLLQGLSQSTVPLMPTVNIQPWNHLEQTIDEVRNAKQDDENFIWIGMDIGDYPSIRSIIMQNAMKTKSKSQPRVIITVGPERGYTEQEATMMKKKGIQLASMGPWIQRTDVACITSIALVMDAMLELHKKHGEVTKCQNQTSHDPRKKLRTT